MAALATQHVQLPFTTMDELAEDTSYMITMSEGGAHQTLFQVNILYRFAQKSFQRLYIREMMHSALNLWCTVRAHLISTTKGCACQPKVLSMTADYRDT